MNDFESYGFCVGDVRLFLESAMSCLQFAINKLSSGKPDSEEFKQGTSSLQLLVASLMMLSLL